MTSEDSAVRAVLGGVYAAWERNDADAFVAAYADQVSVTLPGTRMTDRLQVRANMAAAFAGPLKGSRGVEEIQRIRYVGDDTAIVLSRGAVVLAGETEPPADRWELATWVLGRHSGRWLVEVYHNCPAK